MINRHQPPRPHHLVSRPCAFLLCVSMLCVLCTGRRASGQDATPAPASDAKWLFEELPTPARDALINGEPEYALRLLAGPNAESLPNDKRQPYRSVFAYALSLRLQQGAEGAVADLLLHSPAWLIAEKSAGARQLAQWWDNDPHPTRYELTRRINWYAAIQQNIQPSPLNNELPTRLIINALNHVDHVNAPAERILLLDIAKSIMPDNPIWSSYQPDAYAMKRAAEQMAREENYLAADEIYRRIIYMPDTDAEWFKRKYAENQVNRVFALSTIAGADFAMNAAAQLRQEYLGPTEKVRFQLLKEQFQKALTENEAVRRLPNAVQGRVILRKLSVAYLVQNEMTIEKGGSLIVEPGVVIRGGRIVLQGGTIELAGSIDQPVILVGVSFESDDDADGGIITGRNVQFHQCSIRQDPMKSIIPGKLQIRIDHAYAYRCTFPFDASTDTRISNTEFEACVITMPDYTEKTNPQKQTRTTADANNNTELILYTPPNPVIDNCIFRNSSIDDRVAISATHSRFTDCAIRWWAPDTKTTNELNHAADSADPSTTQLIENIYLPKGAIPAEIQRKSNLTGRGKITFIFRESKSEPILRLGNVKRWVE